MWRKVIQLSLVTIVLPLLVLALMEGMLRTFGYGNSTAPFLVREMLGQQVHLRNRHFFEMFMGWHIPHESWDNDELVIPTLKPTGVYRIFIFGESTPQGWPDPYFSFSRMLSTMLHAKYPNQAFEVHNTAFRAVNSHALVREAAYCAEMQPDMFIIYMGNNEVHGPFGLVSTKSAGARFPSRVEIPLQLALRESRLIQLLNNHLGGFNLTTKSDHRAHLAVRPDDPRLPEVYERYRENLRRMCAIAQENGAGTVICTVGVNQRDWSPKNSYHAPDISSEDVTKFQSHLSAGKDLMKRGNLDGATKAFSAALQLDDDFADASYSMAQALWSLGRFEEAATFYEKAYIDDGFEWVRAKPEINEIVREVAGEFESSAVRVADFAAAVSEEAEHGRPGLDFFDDYCHLNPGGSYLLAQTVLSELEPILAKKFGTPSLGDPLDFETCLMKTGIDPAMRIPFLRNMIENHRFWDGEPEARIRLQLKELEAAVDGDEQSFTMNVVKRANETGAADLMTQVKLLEVMILKGKSTEAVSLGKKLMATYPIHRLAMRLTAEAMWRAGDVGSAEELFLRCIEFYPNDIKSYDRLIELCLQGNRSAEAMYFTKVALRHEYSESNRKYRLGEIAFMGGHLGDALIAYRESLNTAPYSSLAYDGIKRVLEEYKSEDQRIAVWKEIAQQHPYVSMPYKYLARACDAAGKYEDALLAYERAAEFDRADPTLKAAIAEVSQKL